MEENGWRDVYGIEGDCSFRLCAAVEPVWRFAHEHKKNKCNSLSALLARTIPHLTPSQ